MADLLCLGCQTQVLAVCEVILLMQRVVVVRPGGKEWLCWEQALTTLLCGFAAAGGRTSGGAASAQLLRRLRRRLAGRLADGPVLLQLGLVPDAALPAVAWALAVSHADNARLQQYALPGLAPLRVPSSRLRSRCVTPPPALQHASLQGHAR